MAGISSLGIGSGLDLNSLVSGLLQAERSPVQNSLNRRESRLASDLSGVGLMKSALASFQNSLAGLKDADQFTTRTVSNSDSSMLGVSITNEAEEGSYSVEIDQLATRQSVASGAYTNLSDTVGTGSIQIRFGTITGPGFASFAVNPEQTIQEITVDSSNNTLIGLKDTINNGDYGVSASIINDGTGYRLTLSVDESGASHAMEITITDSGDGDNLDASGLSTLAYNASASNLTQTQAAQDAELSVNGLAITSSTNTLNDVIEGVTLSLKETTSSAISVSVNESFSQLSNSIRSLVGSYNDMIGTLNDLAASGGEDTQKGLLAGDSSLRNFSTGLRQLMTANVAGLSGSITAMSNIGISTQVNGHLAIDDSKFTSAIAENPVNAMALFAPVGQTTDSLISFDNFSDNSVAGEFQINLTEIASQGVLNGASGVNNLTVDADNDEMTLAINGSSTGTISLTQGVYATAEELANEIQLQINSSSLMQTEGSTVSVSYDSSNDRFVITSDTYGSESTVEITAVDTNSGTDFGLSVAAGSAGVDVAGSFGGAATGVGQVLTNSDGISVSVIGGATGDRGNLTFSRGIIESLDGFIDAFIDSTAGSLVSREKGLNDALSDIADERVALDLRLTSVEARLIKQFTALDQLIAQFQSTSNFLSQQLANLPGSGTLLNSR